MLDHDAADDAQLAGRIHSGDRDALGAVYDRYAPQAMATAMRIVRDSGTAEDVVHDGFVSAWQKIDSYDASKGTLRTWILTIVRNRALDRVRSRRPSITVEAADAGSLLRSGSDPTGDSALGQISAGQVRQAMNDLPEEQRAAVELAYYGGHTYREIAVMTGVPAGTASGRLRLALGKMRTSLRRSDAAPAEPTTSVGVQDQ